MCGYRYLTYKVFIVSNEKSLRTSTCGEVDFFNNFGGHFEIFFVEKRRSIFFPKRVVEITFSRCWTFTHFWLTKLPEKFQNVQSFAIVSQLFSICKLFFQKTYSITSYLLQNLSNRSFWKYFKWYCTPKNTTESFLKLIQLRSFSNFLWKVFKNLVFFHKGFFWSFSSQFLYCK